MNIIKTSNYEGDYICPICREKFKENDPIYLIKHHDHNGQKPEKINQSRKRKHIFHESCIMTYIEENQKQHNQYVEGEWDNLCPLDREKITRLITVKYYEIAALNIINFSHNYYELIDKFNNKDIINVSVIDRINLNYKDINGKTLLYCACQRGNLKLLKQLVKMGGQPTISDDSGFTPLMAAVTHNYLSVVKYLLRLPSVVESINHIDDRGKTAIEYAYDYKKFNCLLELLKVPGLDNKVLAELLEKYQKLMPSDVSYLGCHEIENTIKNKIKRYLNIPLLTKTEIKKLNISEVMGKIPQLYSRTETHKATDIQILNIDIEKNPDLLDLIYQPLNLVENQSEIATKLGSNELSNLLKYEKLEPDLIYCPLSNKIDKN